jgi:hypothetical protein
MNGSVKYILSGLAALYLSVAPARAQTGYYNADTPPAAAEEDDSAPASHTVVVTSIEKCYVQLGPAETLDIEKNYTKPYEECQKRLALKLKAQQQLKAGQQKSSNVAPATDATAPKTAPQNAPAPDASPPDEGLYYRVQKDPLPPADIKNSP